ncbi:YchJ family protein [Alkalimonas amylolytica]|uniref:SEC-C motif-containing protein n=1 Tax=Alkalimonas amylolytica TaxID=152573 RepID=A0A1H4AYR0_ALKAM|nr:YchJ family metal-binding protein [Alkalimonas amylolytica]SEA41009.1 SEC-C motif-containing protein [Alkalimonas amylolytica]
MHCYCGSGLSYSHCCQPYHSGLRQAETCEQLMRSRYSAFCLKELPYLQLSCVAELQVEQSPEQMRDFVSQVHFVRLQLLPLPHVVFSNDEGYVHFQVWYLLGNQLHSFSELSHFVRQQDRWLYSSGDVREHAAQKVGRNDPCPCGSGRKFKACQPHVASGHAAA